MGLGRYPSTSIQAARQLGSAARAIIDGGRDPLNERGRLIAEEQQALSIPTFEEAARKLHADLAPSFRNSKHAAQWISTLAWYVFPVIGGRLVNTLGPQDFARCLKPIWLLKSETASRVKQRCDAVMDWSAASGHILASPVRVVSKLLPRQPGKRERTAHQPAMPWRSAPTFVKDVLNSGASSVSKAMLELLILTAARSGEVRHMVWGEIDFDKAIWTVPASRMKAKRVHRVPLSSRALEILRSRSGENERPAGLVFPSRNNTPISDMTLTKFLRDKSVASDIEGRHATAHGFRSSFRDWASENGWPRDVAERALAHTIKNASEAAYHRTDLLEQRREMMKAWGLFLARGKPQYHQSVTSTSRQ